MHSLAMSTQVLNFELISREKKYIVDDYHISSIRHHGYYFFAAHFSMATIRGRLLFEGGYYSRAATIRGRLLFEGGYYSRAATIRGRLLFEGGA